jgi:hypothetical protein
MTYIEEYFDIQDLKGISQPDLREIFVATDEPKVIEEIKSKYPYFNVTTYDSQVHN